MLYLALDEGQGMLEKGFGTGSQCSVVLPPPSFQVCKRSFKTPGRACPIPPEFVGHNSLMPEKSEPDNCPEDTVGEAGEAAAESQQRPP